VDVYLEYSKLFELSANVNSIVINCLHGHLGSVATDISISVSFISGFWRIQKVGAIISTAGLTFKIVNHV